MSTIWNNGLPLGQETGGQEPFKTAESQPEDEETNKGLKAATTTSINHGDDFK